MELVNRFEVRRRVEELGAKYLLGWSRHGAHGEFYVAKQSGKYVLLYAHYNERAMTDCSWINTYNTLEELANDLWRAEKGTIPFKRIVKAIKEVFGVDVSMSPKNIAIRALFGEAK